MKNFILYFWQLPQHILGLLLIALYRPERKHIMENRNEIYYASRMKGGISLGKYSIVAICHYRNDLSESLKRDTVRHEAIGHAKQSLYFGWLYLIVIGLFSAGWAIVYGWLVKPTKNGYYQFWTERWADKIAGVER